MSAKLSTFFVREGLPVPHRLLPASCKMRKRNLRFSLSLSLGHLQSHLVSLFLLSFLFGFSTWKSV
jgi:hypothetical protein